MKRRLVATLIRRHRGQVWLLLAWSLLQALPTLLIGRCVAGAVNAFVGGRLVAGLVWLGVLVAGYAVGALGGGLSFGPLGALVEDLRDALARGVVRGALARSIRDGRPDTGAVARLTRHVEIVRDTFAGLVLTGRDSLFALAGALAGLATLAPVTIPLVVVPLLAAAALFCWTLRRGVTWQRDLVLAEEAVSEGVSRSVDGLRDLTACGAEACAATEATRLIDRQADLARRVARLTALRALALALGGRGSLLLILAASPWLVRHGASAGAVVGTLTYLVQGVDPALQTVLNGLGGGGLRFGITLDRVLATGTGRLPEPRTPSAGDDVRLERVTFAYGPEAEPVIHDLDLHVPEGDHLAVVGPSGIGKSTLAGLLAGTTGPQRGTVRTGPVVLIPQEAYVFSGTLRENLTYLAPGADPGPAVAAVGLDALADRLGGYEAVLEPAGLSAGERQLIALARAYLSHAPIAVLDEATCHLDPASEEVAERAFAARPGTLIVIAHRISSARRARRILVLDGTRATVGSHEQLLESCPAYRELAGHWQEVRGGSSPDSPTIGEDADEGSCPTNGHEADGRAAGRHGVDGSEPAGLVR